MPVESPYPPVAVPEVDAWTFYVERPDREYPDDHVLFVDVATSKSLTYEQLRESSEQFGIALQQQWHWRKGDVLALMAPNDIDLVPVTLGALLVGGMICPLNFMYTVDELVSQLKSSKAKGLVTSTACLQVAREAASKVGLPLNRMLVAGNADSKNAIAHFLRLRGSSKGIEKVSFDPKEDLAYLSAAADGPDLAHWNTDRSLGFLPMYHIYGIAVLMLSPVYRGITTHVMQGFNLSNFCKTVERERMTIAYFVPPVALALAKAPLVEQFDLKSLRFLFSAAAPAPKEVIVALHNRVGVPVRQAYGLSEAAPGVSSQRSAAWDKPVGASGRLVPNMSAKIVQDDTEVPTRTEGEICLKGPNIFKGYYGNPTATAQAFDGEGWYRTGDVGRVDEHGNISITDRLKELIKYNGVQVAPAQLEDVLLGHDAVADVAVIGVYSEARATELPRAYIVVADGHAGDAKLADELQHWLAERVSPHKKLRGGIRFVEAIPKSNAGKILRRLLVERAKMEETREPVEKARL